MSAVPKLRFPEFDGHWQDRNLSDFCDVISGHPVPGEDILKEQTDVPLLRGINITEGRIRHSVDIDRYLATSTEGLDRFLVEAGDVVLGMDGSKVGRNVAIVTDSDTGAFLIQRVARMRSTGLNVLDFAYHLIFSSSFHRYVDRINTSSGIPHISLRQIRDFKIPSPSPDEQQKIASFLSSVDKKIDLLRQKKDAVELYKKGLMQKIFSQEIRFKQDDGSDFPDWEEVALGDVASVTKGKQLNRDTLTLGAAYPVINGGMTPSGYHDEFNTKENSITISEGGNSCGYVDFQRQKFWCGGHCYVLEPTGEVIDKKFAFQSLKYRQDDIMRLRVGSGLPNIQKGDLLKLAMVIPPELDEQRKIASFLSAIDAKIQNTSSQIEQMETFKKGLLQQMFV